MITLLILIPIQFWLTDWYETYQIRQERAIVSEQLSSQANSLIFSINQRIALLDGLYAFTRTEWPGNDFDFPFEVFSSELYLKSTGIRTLIIAPHGIARYIYPILDARKLNDYDVVNDPDAVIREDVQRAIQTREITISQPADMPQGGYGIIAWRAVYRGTDLWGLVSISVDVPTILTEVGLSNSANNLDIALMDNSGQTFFGSNEVWDHDPIIANIILPEGSWKLGGTPIGGWEYPISQQVSFFRYGTLILVIFLAGIVYLVVNRQDQLAKVAVLEDRQRLARDLHDSVSQVLYSIGLGVRSARMAIDRNPDQVINNLDYVNRLAEGGQVEMRSLIFELNPDSLQKEGLVAALERLVAVLRTRYQFNVRSEFCSEPEIPLKIKETIFRITQEATHNIIKHSHAGQVELTLDCKGKLIQLVVGDDGIGFDPAADHPGHMGLRSMRDRAIKVKGKINIISTPQHGTRIEFVVRK